MRLEDKFPELRHGVPGESYIDDPRERYLRVVIQLIDKPVFLLLVAASFAIAARGPGWIVAGYVPSGWFVFGLWVCMTVAWRLVIIVALRQLRALLPAPAPTEN